MTPIRIWDLPTRVFHWVLAALVIGAYVTAEIDELEWHERCGLAILVLVISRIMWGVVGSDTARFRTFIKGPRAIVTYFRSLVAGNAPPTLGHNPAGGAFVIILLSLIVIQASLGMFANDEIYFEGPLAQHVSRDLSDTLTEWHHVNFAVLLTAIAIHVLANFLYLFVLKKNLIRPMVTGYSKLEGTVPGATLTWRHSGWAIVIVVLVSLGVGLTIGYR